MTEETNVIHALRRRLRRLAESRLDPAIARQSAAAAIRPAGVPAISPQPRSGCLASGTRPAPLPSRLI